ncbi:hypothetical protein Riv7116_5965 [Rivularia sp. PCC 7116]|uniref:hypothetical protein n=1 Tax=Rivularia sp. PCC 7116 TaxID=373994 RepID=UPI00029F2086|nr:hypothetical protein [Rivularia sp. PCC 7116]AFY58326.1 hypothetical protein Riv7116_5965 [Rivularia sp. PCC 7116]
MNSELIRTEELSDLDLEAMFMLLSKHFKGVKRDIFNNDLDSKNWVILIKDEQTNQLKGFSTLLMYDTYFEDEKISIVFSGDTIVDPSAWSSSALSAGWISSINQLRNEYCTGKLYWLLISGGYRTYRFLPLFWKEFYPRYDTPTPERILYLMQDLAVKRFGENYNITTGVVRFPHPHILRDGLHGIPAQRLRDPHIQYFQALNPGHLNGDELVCFTEICEENLTRAGRRMWFADRSNQGINKNSILKIPA